MDTSILSAFAPGRPPLPEKTAAWMRDKSDLMFIPTLAFQEIRKGIAKLDRAGGHQRAARLLSWLEGLLEAYRERILGVDSAVVAMTAGLMEDAEKAAGRNPGLADISIASTAKTYLRLLTANLRHFEPLGVDCFNLYNEQLQ